MFKKISYLSLFILLTFSLVQSQEKSFGISLSGFLKTDAIYDSRQNVSIREGHFLLYPSAPSLDANGEDLNEKANFNILSIQSRIAGKISAPDAFGAKVSGYLEGEFFGTTDGDINGFRLRHSTITFNWGSPELLIGQFWHPMFIPNCFPGVVSFNTGVPFIPFARNPQIRFKQSFSDFNLYLTANSQRDFQSIGPAGGSPNYLRNSGMPELNGKLEFNKKFSSNEFLLGFAGGYKTLVPRTTNKLGRDATSETISTMEGLGYFKFNSPKFEIKGQGFYGQNATDLLQIGGFAVKSITDPMNVTNDIYEYIPLNVMSTWVELNTNMATGFGKIELALFGGFTQNMGAGENIQLDASQKYMIYGRNADIDMIYRVSPRIVLNSGKARFAFETEYTVANYGKHSIDGTVNDAKDVANLRFLLAAYLFF